MNKSKNLGKEGELIAVNFLKNKQHHIIVCNYKYDRAEVDIISSCNGITIFTEVKTRASYFFGNPEEAVSERKEQQIYKVAKHYIETNNITTEIRFDIIAIVKNKSETSVTHFEDAFFPSN